MSRRRARPLRLEPVEDRCLPSTFHGGPEPLAYAVRPEGPRPAHGPADPASLPAGRTELVAVFWVPVNWGPVGAGHEETVPSRATRQSEPRVVAELAEPPASASAPRIQAAAPSSLSVALPSGGPQTAVNPNAPSATAERPANAIPSAPDGSRSAAADAPAAGVVFLGGVVVPGEADLPDVVPIPFAPAAVPTAPELPSPREVVERVIEAVLPVGLPFAGVVPFEAGAIDAAADLLAKLPSLAPNGNAQDGWASSERWAWVTAGVLVAGGAAYAAGGAAARRTAAPALGADSALARWEDRRGRKPA